MNFKKHMGFVIACGIVALLVIAAGVMVFFGASLYSAENAAYQAALVRYNQLCQRDPFPSETNVIQELDNVTELTNLVSQLASDLRKGQIAAKKMAPEAFISHIQNMARNLSKHMIESGVILPAPNYDFDFDKYVSKGIPPNPAHISGLNYQFQLIEVFCDILADAKIHELRIVKRDSFDVVSVVAPTSARSSRAASAKPPPPTQGGSESGTPGPDSIDTVKPGELFSKIHFSLHFVGNEGAVWTVLNQMAKNRAFIVITRVKLTNPRLTISPPPVIPAAKPTDVPDAAAQTSGTAAAEPQIIPRASRIVVGNELIEAELELDVYRFASPDPSSAATVGKKK